MEREGAYPRYQQLQAVLLGFVDNRTTLPLHPSHPLAVAGEFFGSLGTESSLALQDLILQKQKLYCGICHGQGHVADICTTRLDIDSLVQDTPMAQTWAIFKALASYRHQFH